jgi:repressor LexA
VINLSLAKNIRYLRKKNGFSQDYVAEKLNDKSYTTIQKWEMGTSEPPFKKLKELSELFGVDMDDLANIDLEVKANQIPSDSLPKNLVRLDKVTYIPLLGKIACGDPILAEENIADRILLPSKVNATFALTCEGDSMTGAGIEDGDTVFIRQQPQVENGEIAAVLISDEATLKKVYLDDNKLTLLPMNPAHDPFVFVGKEMRDIRIIGKAVAVLKNIE